LDPTGGSDIWIMHTDRGSKPEPLLQGPFDERDPEFSPGGHWLAYTSNESGQAEVYVRPFGTKGERFQVSTDGGSEPHWSRRGQELLYRQGNRIMAVAIKAGPQFEVSTPTKVLEGSYGEDLMAGMRNWDLAPDGERFVVVAPGETSPPRELHVVLGWTEEVNRRVPGGHAPR
jgi:Tol biopolymer transport system component